jgi:PPOX class probable F420-dependent enzyme
MALVPDSDFGARVRTRLRDEIVIWLTTTGDDGTPQPNPVWFLWEPGSESMLVYNENGAKRLEHVAVRPRVSLNFDGNGRGGDIVVFTGTAEQALDAPSPDRHETYLAKYAADIERLGADAAGFAARYSVPLRIRLTRLRGF